MGSLYVTYDPRRQNPTERDLQSVAIESTILAKLLHQPRRCSWGQNIVQQRGIDLRREVHDDGRIQLLPQHSVKQT